jgi:Co/Zn/Cd efflux system component
MGDYVPARAMAVKRLLRSARSRQRYINLTSASREVLCRPMTIVRHRAESRLAAHVASGHRDPGYRTALVSSAALNIVMFFAEGAVGLVIGSAALIADAADFLEDSGIYSLAVLAIGWSTRNRARAGAAMGCMMTGVGLVALWQVVERLLWGGAPSSLGMASTAAAALAVNLYCATRLAPYKRGDVSMRSIWLSTRNDVILNALTVAAAGLVRLTASAWPDLIAGTIIAAVNLWAAGEILLKARRELRAGDAGRRA